MATAHEIINHLRAPDQRGMGRIETAETGPSNIDRLSALDATAETIRVWDSTIIPGNLQTPAYSGAVIQAAHPKLPHYEVRRRVLLKDQRAKTFLRRTFDENLKAAWFVLGERAVTQCINMQDQGDMHASQLRHVLTLAAHAKIVVQVLPDRVVTPGLADQFTLYGLDEDQRVGYVETIMGSWYSTRLDDVAKLHSTFSDIAREAMSPESTRRFIREVLGSWRSAKKKSPDSTEEPRSSSAASVDRVTNALESQERGAAQPWRREP
ncbi:hypothetical protein ADL00_17310 [Streptomyces sp. AS58]|uniref:DUF5753 domain-containing protein n=1 Tax=Streptomyces sp. AS58 TaxID=1519489 RepID=UPI0006AF5B4F|nr:DUF5753 domain-containing protein [Streptomyces sp. AS58]KOV66575.1 hypothetical protein ADL00_17310 [Streptomyces sp. AS58]